ncbi:ACKR1 protein, partial [Caloenas nicobarica]|nr:ACKR1 protein [Caloenas nicobarica]
SQSPGVLESENSLDLLDIMGNFSYDDNVTFLDYGAAPCHNQYCPVFQRVAPPFLAVTCAAAALGTGALLVALAKRPHAWGWPQSRALVAQLAAAMGLFAAVLPAVAVGAGQGWRLGGGLCRVTHLLWHWSLFAQGLLLGSGCCCGSVWCRWDPRSRRLAVATWAGALVLATPAALTSGTAAAPEVSCLRRSVDVLSPLYLLHLGLCLGLFLLLPAGLLVAVLAAPRLRAGWEPGAGASWLFFALWVPYGVGLAVDFLLRAQLLQPTCGTFERFDYALGLSEGLGVLHCCLGPAALLAARLC